MDNNWTFYTTRGIAFNGKFDPSQIEEALQLGLLPQIILNRNISSDVISSFISFLKHKDLFGKATKRVLKDFNKDPVSLSKNKEAADITKRASRNESSFSERVLTTMMKQALLYATVLL